MKDQSLDWMGLIPTHWEKLPIRSLMIESSQKNLGAINQNYLSLMATVGVLPYAEKGAVGNKAPEDLSKCKLVQVGDFVLNSMNFAIGSFGVSSYDGVCSPVYLVLRPKDNVEARFLKYIFSLRPFQKLAQSFGNGILEHRAAIGWQDLKNLRLPFPPIHEQKAIADFLDRELRQIDRLIQTQERLEALLTERWQGILKATLDPNTMTNSAELFADVPQGWRKGHLKHFAEVKLGKMVEKTDDQKSEGALPYLRAASIQPYGKISLDDANYMPFTPAELVKFSLIKGDVVVVEGGSIGRAAFIEHDMHGWGYQNSINRLRPKGKTNGKYLCYLMQYIELTGLYRTIVNTSTISHLTAEKLQVVKVALPPVHMQQELAQVLDERLESLTNGLRNIEMLKLTLRERRTAFVNAAVTGKIDVRGKS